MNGILDRIVTTARAHRDRPATELLRKVGRSAIALAKGHVVLRACTQIGARARVFGVAPDIGNHGVVRIGADFTVSSLFGAVQLATAREGTLDIGDGVSVNYGTAISARKGIRIGDHTKIGPYCIIADSEYPLPLDLPDGSAVLTVDIGHDVWLGGRVTVLPGTRIGDGAVVSAGSVVSGEIPPNAVASGNPAKVLRITSGPPPSGARPRSATSQAPKHAEGDHAATL